MDLVSEAAGAGGEQRMRRGYRMKREFQSSLWERGKDLVYDIA